MAREGLGALVVLTVLAAVRADAAPTPVMEAVARGDTATVRGLVTGHRKLLRQRAFGRITPLLLAVMERQVQVTSLLIDLGAALEDSDSEGATALHFATVTGVDRQDPEREAHARALQALLLSRGAPVERRDRWGATPLHWAAMYGDSAFVEALLAAGGAVNVVATREGWTPLHGAAGAGHAGVVEVLLRHGADPSLRDGAGRTPLEVARGSGQASIVERLVAASSAPRTP